MWGETLGSGRSATLADFDPHRNGITAVRLGLALTVVASHSFYIGGFSLEPLVVESHDTTTLGVTAVLGFFALSGFLLARSRERTAIAPFLRNRALRILPGYWAALLFVALVASPAAARLSGAQLAPADLAGYVLPRLAFVPEDATTALRGAFGGATINGSLWTLGVEVLCYVFLALVPACWMRPVAVGELAMLGLLWLVAPGLRGPDTALMLAFALGVTAWTARSVVPVSWGGAAVGLGLAALGVVLGWLPLLTLGVAYLALLSAWLPVYVEVDLSYGTYVLAYPIATLLVMAGARSIGPWGLTIATTAIVLPLALLSWTLIERPALALRHGRAAAGSEVALASSSAVRA